MYPQLTINNNNGQLTITTELWLVLIYNLPSDPLLKCTKFRNNLVFGFELSESLQKGCR